MSLKKPKHSMSYEYDENENKIFISAVATPCSDKQKTGHMRQAHFEINLFKDEDIEKVLDECKVFLEMPRILNKKTIYRFYRSITYRS